MKAMSVLGFEGRKRPLLPQRDYFRRLLLALSLGVLSLVIWLALGMAGYHWVASLPWVDAFLNASMIVGGMGQIDALQTQPAKLFAGAYAIFSGVVFLGVFGLMASPIVHRFLHRFHIDTVDEPTS